ncbi:hypothetical protein ABZY42_01895 [Streptomyces sp. NPDC006622]|uniref:hypothetical protein n=1 Tax=Streptomyces sp. NPDC006622 TaxID=3155459 RepID=UPI0033ADC67D
MDLSSRGTRPPLDRAVAVPLDLDEFVVSLDRLGSRRASGTADEHTVGTFIADGDVTRRLAHARSVIGVAVDGALTVEGQLEIEDLDERSRFPTDDVGYGPPDEPI